MKRNVREAKRRLQRLRESIVKKPSPFKGMTLEQAIKKMRKVREKLWKEKFALHSGHK
ncbi:MAG: hypothetical protein HQ595_00965 [Candidatus Omnitrophica bacterium]|nr:hypothetical protein [Candidatus Omnitrophota bacterium]